jgi:hypothetical protein
MSLPRDQLVALPRLGARTPVLGERRAFDRIRIAEAFATAAVGLVFGFLVQILDAAASLAFAPKPTTEFDSGLLDRNRSIGSAVLLLAHNGLVLSGFCLCALLVAGWRPHPRLTLTAPSSWIITGVLFGYSLWRLAAQTASVATQVNVPRLFLVLALPHGPLEFGALATPLVAAIWPRGETAARISQVRRSTIAALLLLVIAAFVESWVSPVLLSIRLGP